MLTITKVQNMIKEALKEYHTANHSSIEVVPPIKALDKPTEPYSAEEINVQGKVPCWPSYLEDLEDDAFLLEYTKVDSLLLKALTDRGYKSFFPKEARKLCIEHVKARIATMTDEEKRLFHATITNKHFSAFAVLWQEIHTSIEKKL